MIRKRERAGTEDARGRERCARSSLRRPASGRAPCAARHGTGVGVAEMNDDAARRAAVRDGERTGERATREARTICADMEIEESFFSRTHKALSEGLTFHMIDYRTRTAHAQSAATRGHRSVRTCHFRSRSRLAARSHATRHACRSVGREEQASLDLQSGAFFSGGLASRCSRKALRLAVCALAMPDSTSYILL